MKGTVSSWGRLSADEHEIVSLVDPGRISERVCHQGWPGLAYGMGRSYGDVCLNRDGLLWCTSGLNHFLSFDGNTGRLLCESGVLLRDIQSLFVPRGWILPVTPGTQLVTVGGAIANDVHGKSHHVSGSFGDHVRRIRLLRTDGETIECAPDENADWFAATVGGLGLTGVITSAEIQLQPVASPWLDTETIPFTSLDTFFQLSADSEAVWEHTVSWIDCLSGEAARGIFMRGNSGAPGPGPQPSQRSRRMPVTPPVSLVNRLSLWSFNHAYFALQKSRAGRAIVHYEPFFYPLDNLLEWNRMYGPRGFYQYQSVVPPQTGSDAVQAMLREIARSGEGSFLAVLKTFGNRRSVGMLGFPRPGVTLALDFPDHGRRTQALFARLDAIVREAGGCLYPAKDARMPVDLFESGYPRLGEFLRYRDPGISSDFSRRILGS